MTPKDAPHLDLRPLVEACLRAFEEGGEAALEQELRRDAAVEPRLRKRLLALRAQGLLAELAPSAEAAESFPERLGEFRLVERLGHGGMGVVYRARQENLGREVALKVVRPEQLFFPGARERFRREVDAVARLQHPGIAQILTVGEERGTPYFAMELVPGRSLGEILGAWRGRAPESLSGADLLAALDARASGAPPRSPSATVPELFRGPWTRVAARIALHVCEALAHAHERGVLHRDVKPSNVMLTPDGRVVLLDFGLAMAEGTSRLTRTGSQLGSLPYMAPEQVRGAASEHSPRTDVYGLGVLLYECLALELPYAARDAEALRARILLGEPPALERRNPAVPWDLETICRTALEREPARRYATATAFAEDLANALALRPIRARRAGVALRVQRWVQRHPTASVALVLAALAFLTAPLAVAWSERNARLEIERALARSERSLVVAINAVDLMLSRVGFASLGRVPQADPVRRALLADAEQLFLALRREGAQSPRLEVLRGRALLRSAHVALELGDLEFAARAADEGHRALQALLEAGERSREARFELAEAEAMLGDLARRAQRFEDAAQWSERARVRFDELVAEEAQDLRARQRVLALRETEAMLLGLRGDPREQERRLRALLDEHASLGIEPREASAEEAHLRCLGNWIQSATFLGEHARAAELGRARYAELAAAIDAPSGALEESLAHVELVLAAAEERSGRAAEALVLLERSIERSARSLAAHPGRLELLQRVADQRLELARSLRRAGRGEEAERAVRASLAGYDELLAKSAQDPLFELSRGSAVYELGLQLAMAARDAEAEELWSQGQERLARLIAAGSFVLDAETVGAGIAAGRCTAAIRRKDFEAAAQHAAQREAWQTHVATERENARARELAIDALLELAGLRAYLGDPATGAALVRRAIERFDAPYAAIAAQRGLEGLLGEERSRALRALAEERAGKR